MTSCPNISIIIPSYNHARYVGAAITSVLRQTYTNYEIIVVDDGSHDNTREVVAAFSERVRYLWQENRGLPGARNTGIVAARGLYLAFLDADDLWEPSFLATVVGQLQAHPEWGAVHTGSRFVDHEGAPLPQLNTLTVPPEQMYDRLIDGEFFAADAVLVHRVCFDQVGLFDERLRASEDWDMWLRVARAYPFGSLPAPLLLYRMHGENMSADPEQMMRYQLMVVEKHFGAAAGSPDQWPRERQRAYAAVYYQIALGYFLRAQPVRGQHYLGKALEANPALAETLHLYYELGCADQPLGRRNPRSNPNFANNAATLLASLRAVFARPDLSPRLRAHRRSAFAHAYLALGTLAYNGGQLAQARHYLWQALRTAPQLARRYQLLPALGKALLPPRLRDALKALT